MATLKAISDDWLRDKGATEKGFSLGSFAPDYLRQCPIATVSHNGVIVAFTNLWRTDAKDKVTIDLMRHVHDAPAGLMDFLFTELLLSLKD